MAPGPVRSSPARRTSWAALFLSGLLVAAACGGGSGQGLRGRREVAIAFVGAKTGSNAELGLNMRDGIRLAIDEENDGGGALTVRLREFDTAGDPAQARNVQSQFTGDGSILGIVGPAFSGELNALVPQLQQAGLVTISASATNKDLPPSRSEKTVFHRIVAGEDVQSTGIAEFLSSYERPTSLAYIHDNSDYGKQLALDTERKTAASGVRTAVIEPVDPRAGDFTPAVGKVMGSGADTVFYGGLFAEAAQFKRRLVELGANVRFVSGEGSLDERFVEMAQTPNAEGARLACTCNLPTDTSAGRLRDFASSYRQRIGRDPGRYSAEGYDAAKLLIQSIKSGSDTRDKLLRHVNEQLGRYDGVSKTIEFAPNGELKTNTFVVYEVRLGDIKVLRTLTLGQGTGTTTTGTTTSTTARITTTTRRRTTTTTLPTTSSTDTTTVTYTVPTLAPPP